MTRTRDEGFLSIKKVEEDKMNKMTIRKKAMLLVAAGMAMQSMGLTVYAKEITEPTDFTSTVKQTQSKEDVFAAGDCCVVKYNPAHDTRYIPLATNAVRMGTLVARNIVEPTLKYMGTQGTSGIKIYEKCIASTGLTEEVAKATTKMNVASVELTDNYRPEFMPTYLPATIKLVFDKDTRRIIGGQIISDIDLTQFMNTLSVVIQNEMTIEELAMTDFFFQPHFNKPWSLLNAVALKAL